MIDSWRFFNQETREYTLCRLRPIPAFSRIDYITPEHHIQFVDKVQITYGYKSDHSIVHMIFVFEPHKHGPGYWKLNVSLLRDYNYTDCMDELLDIELSLPYESFKNKWELTKLTVRGCTIQYAARKQKSNKNKIQVLEKKVKSLEQEL